MNYPVHLAIIPDGNRTRAKKNGLPVEEWYRRALKTGNMLMKEVFTNTPIKIFTWRWLSTENVQQRSTRELEYLFGLFKISCNDMNDFLHEQKINFKWIGNEQWLPDNIVKFLRKKEQDLLFDTERYAVFGINYGWRDEIIRGIKKRAKQGENVENLNEHILGSFMDCGTLPQVDLVIRTKGDLARRTSSFMWRRIGYAELFFSSTLYPAFTVQELREALERYDTIRTKKFW